MQSDRRLHRLIPAFVLKASLSLMLLCLFASPLLAGSMSGGNYSMPVFTQNRGSTASYSETHTISQGLSSRQPVGESKSEGGHQLQAEVLDPGLSSAPFCGLFINGGNRATNSPAVTLGLICSDRDGCAKAQVSNNGFSWSEPIPYATTTTWLLSVNDGDKRVFVKYKDALGNWSGICSASIVLDTRSPEVTATPLGGTYMDPQPVTLSASESATIYYSTGENPPTTSSAVYSGPITIAANTVLKFFAVDTAGNAGPISSQTYTICTGSNLIISGTVIDAISNTSIPLPLVTLNTGTLADTTPNGTYTFSGLNRGEYFIQSVKVAAPGYVSHQKKIVLCQENVLNNNITLTRLDTTFGNDTASGYGAGPVNTSTGNFTHQVKDLAIPGRGMPFSFERGYNSQDTTDGPLGYGWNHSYNISLIENSGAVTVRWGDGRTETWTYDGTGYVPRYGVFSTLAKNPGDGTYTVTMKDMTKYNFSAAGRLTSIVDENNATIGVSWDGSNLSSVTDTVGRVVTFTYDASNHLIQIMDPIGRTVAFSYNSDGDLVSSTDLGGHTTMYGYDYSHQMVTITDPRGNVVHSNMYDELRKVVSSQRDAVGGQTQYSYDELTRTTQIVDPHGNVSHHHYDELLRLVREDDPRGFSAIYVYDASGNIQSVTNKNGNVTTYEYDSRGNVITKTEPLGRITTATYDPATGNPLTKTDARGNTASFSYDTRGNLLTVTDALNGVATNTYDEHGQLVTVEDPLGGVTTHTYDLYGNRVATTDPMQKTSTFVFDGVGRRQSESHPLGRGMLYEYDPMDRLLSITDALGGTSAFTYDAGGNKTDHVDTRGHRTSFAYDKKNRLISKTDPMGGKEEYEWNQLDHRIALRNPKGALSRTVYDPLGNVLQEVDAVGNRIEHEYDGNGNRTRTTDARGYVTTFTYDALNRLVTKKNPVGDEERYEYDLNGNRTKVTDASGRVTTFVYDVLNRLVSVADQLDNRTTNEYDKLGRLTKVTDARNNSTRFEYDRMGRLTKVIDPAEGVVTATYDDLGNRVELVDTRLSRTTYEYDVLNRLTAESSPMGRRTLVYDAVGNLTSVSDARGTTSYTYDKNNRMTAVTYPDNTVATHTYDANGNRTGSSDTMGTIAYTFDTLDRVASITDPFGMTVGYTYDPNRNRTSVRYPGDKTVYYSYDGMNRLTRVDDWGGVAGMYAYDTAGRLSGQVMGNGSTISYDYDNAGRLIGKEDKTREGAVIAKYVYTLDENGNRTGMIMNQPLVPRPDAIDAMFTYDSANRVLTGGGVSYTHDAAGRRTGRASDGVTIQYAYDYNDRLVSATGGGRNDQYRYDSTGRRFASTNEGAEIRYMLDLNAGMETVLAVMDGNNAVDRYYVYGDGLLYSIDAATGERFYYHYDPLGSTVAITDSNGNITDKYAYLPFGELNRSETVHDNRFTYVGKFGVMQEPNGLYFMRARFYDPETRRFLSVDPVKGTEINTQLINRYSYALNSPYLLVDPKGESAGEFLVGIVLGLAEDIGSFGASYIANRVFDTKELIHNWNEDMNSGNYFDAGIKEPVLYVAKAIVDLVPVLGQAVSYQQGVNNAYAGEDVWSCGVDLSCRTGYATKMIQLNKRKRLIESIKQETTIFQQVPVTSAVTGNEGPVNLEPADPEGAGPDDSSSGSVDPEQDAKKKTLTPAEERANKRREAAKTRNKARSEREYQKQQQKAMYVRLATELSKYSVLVIDMERVPAFKSGGGGQGVYGRR